MYETPLGKKYTKREIREMCPGVKGEIYGTRDNIFLGIK